MKRTVPLLVLALLLVLSTAAFAGGEKCAHDAAAHKAMAAKLSAHGWLGIETEKDADGAYRVTKVASGSPAAEAGFRSGDVLVALNGVKLTAANKEAVKKAKAGLGVGKPVSYTVRRDGAETTLNATLAPVPDEVLAKWMKEEEAQQLASKPN